jgi:hypothetical protein
MSGLLAAQAPSSTATGPAASNVKARIIGFLVRGFPLDPAQIRSIDYFRYTTAYIVPAAAAGDPVSYICYMLSTALGPYAVTSVMCLIK